MCHWLLCHLLHQRHRNDIGANHHWYPASDHLPTTNLLKHFLSKRMARLKAINHLSLFRDNVSHPSVNGILNSKNMNGRFSCLSNPINSTVGLSLIHISEPTRLLSISYAVFC